MMTREEAIRAMLDGEKIQPIDWKIGYFYYNNCKKEPFRISFGVSCEPAVSVWHHEKWRLYKEPKQKKRYMAREEVLGFICNTPGIVARYKLGNWISAPYLAILNVKDYEYAYIDKQGNIGEPHKFMVEDE